MANVVLKSLIVENFASFADPLFFTTEVAGNKKEFLGNTFSQNDLTFNKVSFLYGANGSGKTFFCKIIREIKRLLSFSPLTTANSNELFTTSIFKGLNAPVKSFAFDTSYQKKPIKFAFEIVIDRNTYYYEFLIKGTKITYELLTKKYKRKEKLLERTSSSYKDITLHSQLKSFENAKYVVKDEALCLPIAALLNNKLASDIVSAVNDIQVINMATAKLNPTQNKESFSDERIEKYINILRKADPTLRKLKVSYEEKEIARQKIENDDFENREFIAMKTTVGVKTTHAVYDKGEEKDGENIVFFADESMGTVKLFTMLPYLYDTLETGGILIIDELENGLHLSLAKEIINLFTNEKSNPHHAQLICTSHQPLLINGDFRRDQVWITAKDSYGKSSLHRMSELKTSRAKVNLSNKILEGAFGCNPESFFENNT